ncbi:MAG TPA: hypothetical protein VFQ53_17770 [Kofleriaceae bacterium]|nr:hypothetical protein [Kofleriaceae bacterium]
MRTGALVAIACVLGCGPDPRPDEPRDAASPSIDGPSSTIDGASSVDGPAADGQSSGGLDPDLEVPPAGNQPCTTPGSLSDTECPGIAVCRFFSPTEGRCESCVTCGNLNAACSASDQCDILFTCYQGRCTNFCLLGSSECGAPADCIDIGHPTHGVCRPF